MLKIRVIALFILLLGMEAVLAETFDGFVTRVAALPVEQRGGVIDSFFIAHPTMPYFENDTTVYFVYRGSATSVTVPGDINGWSSTSFPMALVPSTDFWHYKGVYPADTRADYKFVLNGSTWILDTRNPKQVMGGFGPNSELQMPRYIPSGEILYRPDIPHGTTRDTIWASLALGNSRKISIYLPPGYESSTDSFSLILFHDGQDYINLAFAPTVLDNLIADKKIKPVIAIFVPAVNRNAEYCGNQLSQFSSFIISEVMPAIDRTYRTKTQPLYRAVMGASSGGNVSLHLALNYPQVFGNVAAQSSQVTNAISTGFQNSPKLDIKLYLDLGRYDIADLIPMVRNFVPIIQSKGYLYTFKEFNDGHSWGNWRAHIDEALQFFFPGEGVSVGRERTIGKTYNLNQNFPNPFNPSTTITYTVSDQGRATIDIVNILGMHICTLLSGYHQPGSYSVVWNGNDSRGLMVPSGVYFFNMSLSSESRTNETSRETRKMILMR